MAKSIRDSKKSKIGRPITTGSGEPQVVRMHDLQLSEIDEWIDTQGEKISRPEAIRRLVEIGLSVNPKASPSERLKAARETASAAKSSK